MKKLLTNVLIGGTLFLEVWVNGQQIDLSKQKVMLNNNPADSVPIMTLNDEPHNNLILTIETLPSPPGPICVSYTIWDGNGDGVVDLVDVIGPLKVITNNTSAK